MSKWQTTATRHLEVQALPRVHDVNQPVVLLLQQTETHRRQIRRVITHGTVTLTDLPMQNHSVANERIKMPINPSRTISGGSEDSSRGPSCVHMTRAPSESDNSPFFSSSSITDGNIGL